jgi:hypothetical protein
MKNEDGCYCPVQPLVSCTLDRLNLLARQSLCNLQFLQVICELVVSSNSANEALRKALVICGHSTTTLKDAGPIISLAEAVGIMVRDENGALRVAPLIQQGEERVDCTAGILSLDSEMGALLHLSSTLGPGLLHSLDQNEQNRLKNAVMRARSEPAIACEDAAKGLENYLRLVGTQDGYDTSGCQGLGEVASYLAGKDRLLIHPKHRDIVLSIAALRNCSAHDRDRLTNRPWVITAKMAALNVEIVTRLIASIHAWRTGRQQLL